MYVCIKHAFYTAVHIFAIVCTDIIQYETHQCPQTINTVKMINSSLIRTIDKNFM